MELTRSGTKTGVPIEAAGKGPVANDEFDILGEYVKMDTRFHTKKHIYQAAGKDCFNRVFFIFIIPLLILQLANAVAPVFLKTSNEDGTTTAA